MVRVSSPSVSSPLTSLKFDPSSRRSWLLSKTRWTKFGRAQLDRDAITGEAHPGRFHVRHTDRFQLVLARHRYHHSGP
jgi:hypothetical protein